MTQMQATANRMQARNVRAFALPFDLRSLALKALIGTAIAMTIMAIAYFGFAINLGLSASIAFEHISNTAQHSLQSNFNAPYIQHYGFKSLFPAQQRVYADIYRAAYLTRETVTVSDLTAAEIADLVKLVREDSPELFYLDSNVDIDAVVISTAAERSVSTVTLHYTIDAEEIPTAREAFQQTLSETAAPAVSCQSDANKVNMIQSWMKTNTPYSAPAETENDVEAQAESTSEDSSTGTAYDVLMNEEVSESGNAQLFNALCSEAGIDSRTVNADESPECENATNAVMLGGDWHYVDIAEEAPVALS